MSSLPEGLCNLLWLILAESVKGLAEWGGGNYSPKLAGAVPPKPWFVGVFIGLGLPHEIVWNFVICVGVIFFYGVG